MMILLATLQGNGSANSLTASNISSEYKKIIVKGAVRLATNDSARLVITPNNGSSSFTNHGLLTYDVNIQSWGNNSENVSTGIRPFSLIPQVGNTTGAHMHFEMDFSNRNDGRQKIAIGWASQARDPNAQTSEIFGGDMETTSTFTSLTFTNSVGVAFASTSIIHVYGVK